MNKPTKRPAKLALTSETLRTLKTLELEQLREVAGGYTRVNFPDERYGCPRA